MVSDIFFEEILEDKDLVGTHMFGKKPYISVCVHRDGSVLLYNHLSGKMGFHCESKDIGGILQLLHRAEQVSRKKRKLYIDTED